MSRVWTRVTDGGWLTGKPAYVSGDYYIAQDYDDLDTGSQKLSWFLHDENGFIAAFDTLRAAKAHVKEK